MSGVLLLLLSIKTIAKKPLSRAFWHLGHARKPHKSGFGIFFCSCVHSQGHDEVFVYDFLVHSAKL